MTNQGPKYIAVQVAGNAGGFVAVQDPYAGTYRTIAHVHSWDDTVEMAAKLNEGFSREQASHNVHADA